MLTTQREGRTEIIYYVIPLIATVSMAVVSDFRDWRIPNRLIAVGMIQGFLMSAVVRGPCDGLLSSVAGCVIPAVILFVLFHKKALGAGDIKLLATAGTFVGTDVIRVIVYSFLAGGVISLFFLLKYRKCQTPHSAHYVVVIHEYYAYVIYGHTHTGCQLERI